MKKAALIMMVLLMTVSALYAQTAGEIAVGVRGGVMFGFSSAAESTDGVDDKMLINPNFALYGNYAIIDKLSVQLEANVQLFQGLKQEWTGGEGTIKYSSIDIPLLVKYSFINDPLLFGILAGPYLSIPIGDFAFGGDEGNGPPPGVDVTTTGINFGATGGVYAGYPLGPGRIVGDLRFLYDFTVTKSEASWVGGSEEDDALNRMGLAFTVGYEYVF